MDKPQSPQPPCADWFHRRHGYVTMASEADEPQTIVPADCWDVLPREFKRLLLVDALLDQNELQWRESDATIRDVADMDVALADLLIDAPGATSLFSDLCSRTRQGQQVPGVETLADMHPKIAELMRDGSQALLSMAPLRTAYAKFTCALCGLCSSRSSAFLYGCWDL
eukprot:s3944_g2.t1